MRRKKCCSLFWNNSFRSRHIQVLQICKLAKWWWHTPNQILNKNDEKHLSQVVSEMFDSFRKILLNMLYNKSLTGLLPWQHTGFQASSILEAFLATFGIPFWYLFMVPRVHDPVSVQICYLEFVAWFNVFRFKNHWHWNQVSGDWKRVSCHGNIC